MKVEEYNNICVLTPSAELMGDEVAELRRAVDEAVDKKQIVDMVVDLEKCPFVDSEGLETLLWVKRRCEDLFGQLKLSGMDENVAKILEITRLEPRFDCSPDLTAALKTMR
jgi:anti-anti-sigma factor